MNEAGGADFQGGEAATLKTTARAPGRIYVRKWFSFAEETKFTEMGVAADGEPLHKFVIAAAIKNPWAGKFGQDLSEVIQYSKGLGGEFGERLLAVANGMPIVSYGKACIVGTDGEYEHGNAFVTATFADPIRDALGGALAWVPSTGKRGGPGTPIDVPLANKDALYVRSHYDTVTVTFGDAPSPEEVVVIFAAATRGRLRARLGGLTADKVEGRDGLR